jgi:signal transduction histidine kinase
MVAPVRWEEASDSTWWMRLRCGACGFAVDTVVDDDDADAFDRELGRQTREIAAELAASERRRMAEELHALSVAFELDLIDAGDFQG